MSFGVEVEVPDIRVTVKEPNVITDRSTFPPVADLALSALSASYAGTSSIATYALATDSSSLFPFTGSADYSGSLTVVGDISSSIVQTDEFQLNAGTVQLIFTGSVNSGIFGATEYIRPFISTTRYSGMTVEYMAQRPGACRMGIIMAAWLDTGSITFTDISTTDIGDTSDITFRFLSGSNELRLRVNSAGSGSGAWTVQSLFKLFPNLNP